MAKLFYLYVDRSWPHVNVFVSLVSVVDSVAIGRSPLHIHQNGVHRVHKLVTFAHMALRGHNDTLTSALGALCLELLHEARRYLLFLDYGAGASTLVARLHMAWIITTGPSTVGTDYFPVVDDLEVVTRVDLL